MDEVVIRDVQRNERQRRQRDLPLVHESALAVAARRAVRRGTTVAVMPITAYDTNSPRHAVAGIDGRHDPRRLCSRSASPGNATRDPTISPNASVVSVSVRTMERI